MIFVLADNGLTYIGIRHKDMIEQRLLDDLAEIHLDAMLQACADSVDSMKAYSSVDTYNAAAEYGYHPKWFAQKMTCTPSREAWKHDDAITSKGLEINNDPLSQ